MMFLLANILFVAVGGIFGAAVEDCHTRRLQACGDPLSDFRKEIGQKFPTTEEQVVKLCGSLENSLKCVQEYQASCMSPTQVELVKFLSEGSMEVYNDFCTEGSAIRNDYLKNAPCMNEAAESDEAKEQYSYVEASLEDLNDKPHEQKLPTACCGYQWLTKHGEILGTEKCGKKAVESYNKVMKMAVSNLPDVFCSGFDPEGAECKKVLPPPGTKPKGNLKNSPIAQMFSSMYLTE